MFIRTNSVRVHVSVLVFSFHPNVRLEMIKLNFVLLVFSRVVLTALQAQLTLLMLRMWSAFLRHFLEPARYPAFCADPARVYTLYGVFAISRNDQRTC